MKVVDKINKAENEGRTYWSFEYFPPKTDMVSHTSTLCKSCIKFINTLVRVFKTCMIVWRECSAMAQSL